MLHWYFFTFLPPKIFPSRPPKKWCWCHHWSLELASRLEIELLGDFSKSESNKTNQVAGFLALMRLVLLLPTGVCARAQQCEREWSSWQTCCQWVNRCRTHIAPRRVASKIMMTITMMTQIPITNLLVQESGVWFSMCYKVSCYNSHDTTWFVGLCDALQKNREQDHTGLSWDMGNWSWHTIICFLPITSM